MSTRKTRKTPETPHQAQGSPPPAERPPPGAAPPQLDVERRTAIARAREIMGHLEASIRFLEDPSMPSASFAGAIDRLWATHRRRGKTADAIAVALMSSLSEAADFKASYSDGRVKSSRSIGDSTTPIESAPPPAGPMVDLVLEIFAQSCVTEARALDSEEGRAAVAAALEAWPKARGGRRTEGGKFVHVHLLLVRAGVDNPIDTAAGRTARGKNLSDLWEREKRRRRPPRKPPR